MNKKIDNFLRRVPDNFVLNKVFSFITSLIYLYIDKKKKNLGRSINPDILYLDSNPLISVYVPTYNRASILKDRAISSVLAQTYKNFEFIISDDGSTDNAEEVVKSFNDPRIRYIRTSRKEYRYPNKSFYHWLSGPVIAANAALKECKGLWTARIDDDDVWTEDHLEKLLKFAINGNYEFVSSHNLVYTPKGKEVRSWRDDPRDPTGIGATQTWLYRNYLNKIEYNIHSWRKSYFSVNDTDLKYRMYKSNVRTGFLEDVTVITKTRPDEDYIGSNAYIQDPDKYEKLYG